MLSEGLTSMSPEQWNNLPSRLRVRSSAMSVTFGPVVAVLVAVAVWASC